MGGGSAHRAVVGGTFSRLSSPPPDAAKPRHPLTRVEPRVTSPAARGAFCNTPSVARCAPPTPQWVGKKRRVKSCHKFVQHKRRGIHEVCHAFWCGRQDLNLHGCPLDSKSNASAYSATSALIIKFVYYPEPPAKRDALDRGSRKRLRSEIFWEEEPLRRLLCPFRKAGRTQGKASGDEVCLFRHVRIDYQLCLNEQETPHPLRGSSPQRGAEIAVPNASMGRRVPSAETSAFVPAIKNENPTYWSYLAVSTQHTGLCGGNDRTRICDLLHVKQAL